MPVIERPGVRIPGIPFLMPRNIAIKAMRFHPACLATLAKSAPKFSPNFPLVLFNAGGDFLVVEFLSSDFLSNDRRIKLAFFSKPD
jgi:hypothetical protein